MKEEQNIVKYGRSLYRNEYLKSDEWKRLRSSVLRQDKNTCFKCNKKAEKRKLRKANKPLDQ